MKHARTLARNARETTLMTFAAAAAIATVAFPWPASAGAEEAPPKAPEKLEVKVEGAQLTYAPVEIPRPKRTARGELDMIERAAATLRVEKPIAVRRASLPAGEYAVRVESEDGRSFFLVVEDKDAPAAEEPKAKPSKGARRKKRADVGEAAGGGRKAPAKAAGALEKREEGDRGDGPPAAKEKDAPGADRADDAARADGEADKADRDDKEGKDDEADEAQEPKAPPPEARRLRAPLALSPCEKAGNGIGFELKSVSKGTKLRVTVRAGGTQARATLRFGET
ncbi:MAG: hypothetical protein HY721_08600 [Planctomycetes bacterium]|nr:hypothetical protein [Planctomycetota bacterium]